MWQVEIRDRGQGVGEQKPGQDAIPAVSHLQGFCSRDEMVRGEWGHTFVLPLMRPKTGEMKM